MNICIIDKGGDPRYLGGIRRVSQILAKSWIQNGHNVFFVISGENSMMKEVPYFYLPTDGMVNMKTNIDWFSQFIQEHKINIVLNPYITDPHLTKLVFCIKSNTNVKVVSALHFAVSHFNDMAKYNFFIGYKMNHKITLYFKECLLFTYYWVRKKWLIDKRNKSFLNYIYEKSDSTVLLSDAFIPLFKKIIQKNIDKLAVIHNPCIIPTSTKNCEIKKKWIIWCGNLEYGYKRVDRVMKIWHRISNKYSDWKLIVIGPGNVTYFKTIAQKENIHNIVFVGPCDPIKYYEQGALLCMTSSSEGWGMVLVEAQSYGCVPIAYNSFASIKDIIINKKNGFQVPAFEEDMFVEKLQYLIDNHSIRNKMAAQAIESVRRFNSEEVADKWINLFYRLIQ